MNSNIPCDSKINNPTLLPAASYHKDASKLRLICLHKQKIQIQLSKSLKGKLENISRK